MARFHSLSSATRGGSFRTAGSHWERTWSERLSPLRRDRFLRMASTLSPPARTPLPISAKPPIANAVPELFSGMTLPVQSIRYGAFLPSGAESGLEVHDQCDRTPRP